MAQRAKHAKTTEELGSVSGVEPTSDVGDDPVPSPQASPLHEGMGQTASTGCHVEVLLSPTKGTGESSQREVRQQVVTTSAPTASNTQGGGSLSRAPSAGSARNEATPMEGEDAGRPPTTGTTGEGEVSSRQSATGNQDFSEVMFKNSLLS